MHFMHPTLVSLSKFSSNYLFVLDYLELEGFPRFLPITLISSSF